MQPVCIITGASRGIGLALTKQWVARGMRVIGVARSEDALMSLAHTYPDHFIPVTGDLSDPAAQQAILGHIQPDAHVQYCLYNAATLGPVGDYAALTESDWRKAFEVNVTSAVFLTQKILPYLHAGARVLAVGTGAIYHPDPAWMTYCASKAALDQVVICWQKIFAPKGILAGMILPGVVDTAMQADIRQFNAADFPNVKRFIQYHQAGALIPPETVAAFVDWIFTKADAKNFSEKPWDVYDTTWHSEWLNGHHLPRR